METFEAVQLLEGVPHHIFSSLSLPEGDDVSLTVHGEGFHHKEWWTHDWNKLADEIRKSGTRNCHNMTIAPTGSISMIADSSSGLEPQFAIVFEKHVTVGSF